MFSKFINTFRTEKIDNSFIKGFYGIVNLYLVDSDKKQFLGENCKIWFEEDKDSINYCLNLKNDENKLYQFPINKDIKPEYFVDSQKSVVGFEWNLPKEENKNICLEFFIYNDEYDEAGKFKQILCRLIYQSIHKTSFRNAKNEDEIYCLIRQKDAEKLTIPNKILDVENNLEKDNKFNFIGISKFQGIDYKDEGKNPTEIKNYCIFTICKEDEFEYFIHIYDENKELIYKKKVNENLYYTIDIDQNQLTWMDMKDKEMVCFNIVFYKFLCQKLNVILNICILETKKEVKFDDFIKKENNEWDKHYLNNNDDQEYNDYEDVYKNKMVMDYDSEEERDYDIKDEFDEMINTFSQAKLLDRTFVSKGNNLGVYKTDEETGDMEYLCNLPPVKSLSGSNINPQKIQIQEEDTKALLLNKEKDNNLYYLDFESGKIINEFKNKDKNYGFKDISLLGKDSEFTNNPVFMSIDDRSIMRFDPRVKKSLVNDKSYKTNVNFNCLSAGNDNWFTAGSKDGNIRLYKELGGNAKNVLPSFSGDPILFIDTSKKGDFILATCKKYIMLIPTYQQNKSGFSTTFRKDNKPQPKILKITPRTMAKYGIEELNFGSAKFDHKKSDKETLIIASSDNYLIMWNLSNVMRGKMTTTKIRKLGNNIINHDFKYNKNNLIAATNNKLSVYNTKIREF